MSEADQVRLTAVPVDLLVRLLQAKGARHVDEAAIRADIAAGAPTNTDGSINLVDYAAWLVREMADGA